MAKATLKTSRFQRAKKFIKSNRQEIIILAVIVLFASFLRLYRISEYMTFLGDEGRDVIVVRRLLLYADPILVGPGTSIGNMYLGPLYYYFMAPWLWLANFSPVGPAIGVASLGILTVGCVWYIAREWFGKVAAIVASLLYSLSPVVIIYSRSSWNPNIMPFFALITIYSIWKVWYYKSYRWLLLTGLSFGFVLQSHYLGLLLLPTVAVFWIFTLLDARKNKQVKSLLLNSALSAAIFGFLMSPLVIFDARHGWRNTDALKKFFFERQTTVSAKPWSAFPKVVPLGQQIITRLVSAKNAIAGNIVLAILFLPIYWLIKSFKQILVSKEYSAFLILFLWFVSALIGFGVYKQEIYDHYYGFIFPIPFLILGGLSQKLVTKSRIRGGSLVIVGVLVISILNLLDNPLRYSPNRQLQNTQNVANKIIEYSDKKPFNLAVIAERNYDDAYQYFLENQNATVVDIDPQRSKETITEQLFVVCEMAIEKCDPTHNPKAEVANFGWSKIVQTWSVSGVNVFKLEHTQ